MSGNSSRDRRVYVGNLDSRVNESELVSFFSEAGVIKNINIKKGGYGFVEYDSPEEAKRAVLTLSNTEFNGKHLKIEHSIGHTKNQNPHDIRSIRREERTYKIVVEDIPSDCTWHELKDWSRRSGRVSYADVIGNKGILHFRYYSDLTDTYPRLKDSKLRDKPIVIYEDKDDTFGRKGYIDRSYIRDDGDRDRDRDRSRYDRRSPSYDHYDRRSSRYSRRDRDRYYERSRSRSPRRERDYYRRDRSRSPYSRYDRYRSSSPRRDRSRSPRRYRDRRDRDSRSPRRREISRDRRSRSPYRRDKNDSHDKRNKGRHGRGDRDSDNRNGSSSPRDLDSNTDKDRSQNDDNDVNEHDHEENHQDNMHNGEDRNDDYYSNVGQSDSYLTDNAEGETNSNNYNFQSEESISLN